MGCTAADCDSPHVADAESVRVAGLPASCIGYCLRHCPTCNDKEERA